MSFWVSDIGNTFSYFALHLPQHFLSISRLAKDQKRPEGQKCYHSAAVWKLLSKSDWFLIRKYFPAANEWKISGISRLLMGPYFTDSRYKRERETGRPY